MQSLPIDAVVPEIIATLARSHALVLEAPPGAGKTTRVPWALARQLGGEVWVAEPRRLAARLSAARVAHEQGERLGETVGFSVRFEDVSGPKTRVRYVTEGVLMRRLLGDPELTGVAHVVLDEFHERSLTSDLLLALLHSLRRTRRPDLNLLVMSATLDAEPVARHLGAERLRSEGRMFPLEVEHAASVDERPLDKRVVSAVRHATGEDSGDVLVFLPGSSEIRAAMRALEPLSAERGLLVLPLHGELPIAEQNRAIEAAAQRKVVLSTNVAETSVTIDGVATVIDSGLARVASHSPWSGLPTLQTARISRASAIQRAGRAGRTREGRVLRLYTKSDFEARPEHDLPEVSRADLSEAVLMLSFAGFTDPSTLPWLTAPPSASLGAAQSLLELLGAIETNGRLTERGRRLLDVPLPPRLARVVTRGAELGVAREAALAAALLSERDIRSEARVRLEGRGPRRELGVSGPCDVLELSERFREAEDARFHGDALRRAGLDPRAVAAVEATRKRLLGKLRSGPRPVGLEAIERNVRRAILAGFPDRVARRRRAGEPDLVLARGGSVRLGETSVVHEGEWLVAVAAEESAGGRGAGRVRLATRIDASWLLEDFPDRIEMKDELVWNAELERVDRIEGMAFGSTLLDEARGPAAASPGATRLLVEAARSRGLLAQFGAKLGPLRVRLALLGQHFPELPLPQVAAELDLETAVELCAGCTNFSELRALEPNSAVLSALTPEARRALDREVPERLSLPGGRQVSVNYESDRPPWIESRLQDFFGMGDGPRLCGGRVPVTLHLLAPNQRAVQVTSDLSGFWQRHYPATRRELMRKYPRHPWPEDGRHAEPPAPRPPRR